ncbi:hypothetical protein ES702_05886 [subsurface metagenome]
MIENPCYCLLDAGCFLSSILYLISFLFIFIPLFWVQAAQVGYVGGKYVAKSGILSRKDKPSEGDPAYPRMPRSNNRICVLPGFDVNVYNDVGFDKYMELAKLQIRSDWILWSEYARVYGVSRGDDPLNIVATSGGDSPDATFQKYGYIITKGTFTNQTTAAFSQKYYDMPYTTAVPDATSVHPQQSLGAKIGMSGDTKYIIMAGIGLIVVFLVIRR